MTAIIVKSYEHINRSLPNWDTPNGRYIKNKDQYDREMKQAGFISYEEAQRRSSARGDGKKQYIPSKDAIELLRQAKANSDKNGNVKLSGRSIDKMIKIGAIAKKIPAYMDLPSAYKK